MADFSYGRHDDYSMAHRVSGRPVLPGMLMLALALRATQDQRPGAAGTVSLRQVRWPASAWVDERGGWLATAIGPDGRIDIEAVSAGRREVVFQGDVAVPGAAQERVALAPDVVEALIAGTAADAFYEAVEHYGIEHDSPLRVVQRSRVEGDRVMFSAVVDALPQERDFPVSAALLNAAFGALLALRPRDDERVCLPLSIAGVDVFAPLQGACVGVTTKVRSTVDTFVADVDFHGRDGRLAVRLRGLVAYGVASRSRPAAEPSRAQASHPHPQAGGPEAFLLNRVAELVRADPATLNPMSSLMDLGLTSVQLLDLAGHVEQATGVSIYPTFFYEYQTVSAAAGYLAEHWPADAHAAGETTAVDDAAGEAHEPTHPAAMDGQVAAPPHDDDPHAVAIIGMGCRFADSATPAEFWQHLADADDLVGEVPADRWDMSQWFDSAAGEAGRDKSYCRWGSFIDGVDRFDAAFFGIAPTEARSMDPQLRLLLEVLYNTIEDAGLGQRYRGSNTGVYVGSCFREYMDEMLRQHKPVGAYDLTGSASTFLSNRASYAFDLRGPSMTIDVACSSSLVALHLACAALRAGEADTALVAGTNLLLSPVHFLHFSALQALSPTGRCHAFDSRADGYVPGEGVAAVMLKPLSRALADGDRIHAVIRGSAVNHGGRSNSPTAPSITQQAEVLRMAWADARIDPRTLGYIEAHGTGTRLGDPIEIEAINKALAPHVPVMLDCHVGSVKSNIGHTEGTAGLAGLIKVVQMLRHGRIPRMPNLVEPNPLLRLSERPLILNRASTPWPRPPGERRRAGVSSFGIGGGYAHAVLEEAPPAPVRVPRAGARVFPISAPAPSSLRLQARAVVDWIERHPDASPERLAAHLQHGKEALPRRMAVVASGLDELGGLLRDWLATVSDDALLIAPGCVHPDRLRTIATDWLQGRAAEWPESADGALAGDDALPYRFERSSFWFEVSGPARGMPSNALVDGARPTALRMPASTQALRAPWLGQHRLRQQAIVPGVVHLEIFAQAAMRAGEALPLVLRDVYWLAPMHDGAPYVVDLQRTDATSPWAAELRFACGELLASAEVRQGDEVGRPAAIDVQRFLADARRVYRGDELYEEVGRLGLELGAHFRTIESVVARGDESLAILGESLAGADDLVLAPSIMDGINHCLRGLQSGGRRLGLAVPYHIGAMVCHASTREARYLHGRNGGHAGTYDIQVLDGAGQVLVEIRGFLPRDFDVEAKAAPAAQAAIAPAARRHAAVPASATVLRQLQELMSEATGLSVQQIDSGTDLGALGVDSVAVAQFTRKLNRRFDLSLTPAHYFDHKDLRSYADFLGREFDIAAPSPAAPTAPVPAVEPPPSQAGTAPAIAIIGASGRFPGCADLDDLWRRLLDAEDLVGEVPPERFDWRQVSRDSGTTVRHGAFLDDIDLFAASTFGVSRREAELMDPQQRLVLESVHELFLDAGYTRADLRGTDAGVFIGVVNNEYYELLNEGGVAIEAHTATGMARCLLSNRVSHQFDLCGPSEVVDTACSSSLVAVHRAIQSIQFGECAMAVAGGVNLLLTPKLFVSFSKAGMLSPDGRCKTFGANANGYVRGEGCGMVLLKRLDDALRDGDAIYAVIHGSGVGHGGRTPSLTAPNPQAQADLVSQVLRRANVAAEAVGYIEAHGTGTPLGDPIEINGLKRVFGSTGATGCGIGSIKSNMGHLEGAAGIAGLLKVVLAIQHRTLPASLHARELNPQVELQGTPLYVVGESQDWRSRRSDCIAGVSSFGFGGVNAHVLLGGRDDAPDGPGPEVAGDVPMLLSASSEAALRQYARQLSARLSDDVSRLGAHAAGRDEAGLLADLAHTLLIGREQLAWRAAFVVRSRAELSERLEALARGDLGGVDASGLQGRATDVGELSNLVAARDWQGAIALWLAGSRLPWSDARAQGPWPFGRAQRMSLPTPPMARERYWLPGSTRAVAPAVATASPAPSVPPAGVPAEARAPRAALINHPFFQTT